MAWIRLSDDYLHDEKFRALSDGAFRLWHEGLAYCRRHQTDGVIPFLIMRDFYSFSKGREKQLATASREGLAPLWELIPKTGYKVHNYLAWNESKEEENERRVGTRDRMRAAREDRRQTPDVPPLCAVSAPIVRAHILKSARDVPDRDRDPDRIVPEKEREKKPDAPDLADRAGRLREELYPAWYAKYRHGAKLRISLIANTLEFQEALSLVSTWDDARLEKLARIVLTTNDEFIAGTDRGFKIFAMKASWADDRLRQIESQS